ncbi:MAG: glycosyltransferase family 2 protein [Elusimicrobiota bacterium]
MKPRVSVIILNYNYSRYLPQAIESVLAQDIGQDLEIVAVDDGSTDDSDIAIRPYLDRVKWLPQRNTGQVGAFNAGWRSVSGELIALLESDDLWEPSKLRETLVHLNENSKAALVQHWMLQVDAENRPLPGYDYPAGPARFSLSEALGGIPHACTSSIVFHAEKLRPYLPLPEGMLFGADICLRLIAATLGPLANTPKPLGRRRIHGRNLFGETLYDSRKKLEKGLPLHKALVDYHKQFLTRQKILIDPAFPRGWKIDGLQMEMFLARYQEDWVRAWRAWAKLIAASGPRGYTFFKGASLLLAMISPALYLRTQRFYAKSPAIRKMRKSLLPFS